MSAKFTPEFGNLDRALASLDTFSFADAMADMGASKSDLDPTRCVSGKSRMDLGVRRQMLRRLGSRDKILALARADPDSDPLERTLVDLLDGKLRSLKTLGRTDLTRLAIVRTWLDGIIDDLPPSDEITLRIAAEDLRAPLKKLVSRGFVGRESELTQLAHYVDLVEEKSLPGQALRIAARTLNSIFNHPPVMVFGPGGVGKSTLVAKFVLDHLGAGNASFAYLDFDRATLRSRDPAPMLAEFLRQMQIQHPEMEARAADVIARLRRGAAQFDDADSSKSLRDLDSDIADCVACVNEYTPKNQTIVFVLDTFEEVQFFGSAVVQGYLRALDKLHVGISGLRLVISGRAKVEKSILATSEIPLRGFDRTSSEAFLRKYIDERTNAKPRTPAIDVAISELARALTRVGQASPLTLTLAAENAIPEIASGSLATPEGVVTFVRKMKSERMRESLYGRILDHLHEPDLRAIAYPGLVLRRIDPDVILRVLAPGCELVVRNAEHAQQLFDLLEKEVALIEPEENGSGVRHRADVRTIMLEELDRRDRAKVKGVENAAVLYYRDRSANNNARDRAEEIYHMMRLGASSASLDKRWLPDVGRYLLGARNEVPPAQRAWLSSKLRLGLEGADLRDAEQHEWERVMQRRARQFLSRGDLDGALAEIETRPQTVWSKDGPMFLLAVEIQAGRGDFPSALALMDQAVDAAALAEDPAAAARAVFLELQIREAMMDWQGALRALDRAASMRDGFDSRTEFRLLLSKVRLLRVHGSPSDEVDAARAEALAIFHREDLRFLAGAPALLREAVAEFGADDRKLFTKALQVLGLELPDDALLAQAARAFELWNTNLSTDGPSPIATSLDLDGGPRAFEVWLRRNRGRAADVVLDLEARYGMSRETRAAFAALYGEAVQRSVRRSGSSAPKKKKK